MDHHLELIIPILEILEIEVSNILYNPGNIGNLSFSNSSYTGNIGNLLFSISHMVEMRAAGGRLQGLGSEGLAFLFFFFCFCFFGACSWNFVTCPISGNNTFPRFWCLFGTYLALFLFDLIGPYLALTVKQKRNTEGPHR